MIEEQLAGMFAEGTAPARDAAFAGRVRTEIGRARFSQRLATAAMRVLLVLTLAAALFAAARTVAPILAPIAEISPRFMGVPAPLLLVVLALGLLVHLRRFVIPRTG